MKFSRRRFLGAAAVMPLVASPGFAQTSDVWSVEHVQAALAADEIRLIDVRRPEEWAETGVAKGAWPLDMTAPDFSKKIFLARDLAQGRPIALICRTANRTGFLMQQIRKAGLDGFIDTKGGMAGKGAAKGWIESDLPIVSVQEALAMLPSALR